MKKTVYFDTNVFDHIHKGIGVTEDDRLALRSAVKTGRISLVLSFLNLEEVLSSMESSPSQANAELQLILDLADWQRVVKPPNMLLGDDICCYAKGEDLPDPFIAIDPVIQSNLRALMNPSQKEINDLWPVIREAQQQKENFVSRMKEANEKVLPYAKDFLRKSHGRSPNWLDYWIRLEEGFAEGFAEHEKVLDACKQRGIKGLLALRSVRMAVGASISLAYAETFEKRTPKIGDSRDMQHAILAAATDTFVINDKSFARLLGRVPINDFQVLDLHAFMERIC